MRLQKILDMHCISQGRGDYAPHYVVTVPCPIPRCGGIVNIEVYIRGGTAGVGGTSLKVGSALPDEKPESPCPICGVVVGLTQNTISEILKAHKVWPKD